MKKKNEIVFPFDVKAVVFTKDVNGEPVFPNYKNIVAVIKKKIRY